jgi:crossover junction endodeoxyribonuclease RuvC
MDKKTVVVGVDPGSYRCGVAVMELDGDKIKLLDSLLIVPEKDANQVMRVYSVYSTFKKVLEKYSKTHDIYVAGEMFISMRAMFGGDIPQKIIGGLFIAAVEAGALGYREFNKKTINKTVTGFGGSSKRKISKIDVKKSIISMGFDVGEAAYDVYDAIAVAITFARNLKLEEDNDPSISS